MILLAATASPARSQQLEDRERSTATPYAWYFDVSVATVGEMVDQGYRIIDVEVASGSPLRVHAALIRNAGDYGKGWWWYFGLTEAQVGDVLRNNGARLIDIEPYDDGSGTTKFFAIMIRNSGSDGVAWSWQYNTSPAGIQQHLGEQSQDRIVDLDQYTIGQRSYFSAIYVRNTDAHARAWWWYIGIAADQIDDIARTNNAMIVDIEPTGTGTFNVLMQRVPGGNPAWWWYVGVDGDTVANALQQHGARPISVKRWWTYDGDRFAVVMVSNSGAPGGNPPSQPTPPPSAPPGGSGQVMLWMDSNLGQLEVLIGGTRGTITHYYSGGTPSCGATGTVTATLPIGSQPSYSASCVQRNPLTGQSQLQWHGITTVAAGCTAIKLTAQSRCDGTPNNGGTPPPSGGGGNGGGGNGGGNGGGVPGAVSPVPFASCPQAFVDSSFFNWVAFRNTCSQPIHLTWFYGNGDRTGSGANIAAGGKASTGYTQSELQQRGGYVVYPCPLGYLPVEPSGRPIEYGAQRKEYVCRPQ